MRLDYFAAMNDMVPWGLARRQVEQLARDFVENTARMGVYEDAHVFSTDVGALKPDPAMYARILALLGVAVLLFCIGKMKAPDEALAYRERRPD